MLRTAKHILSLARYKGMLAYGRLRRLLLQPECYSNGGIRVEVNYEDFPDVIIDHMLCGLYETDELSVLSKLLDKDDRVIDIGAGIGFISAYIAKQLGPSGSIECFEANPQLIHHIRQTHQLNGVEVPVHNRILGQQDGEMDFYISPQFWASSLKPIDGVEPVKVPTVSFQLFLDEFKPSMLVVDIEGGEIELFDKIDLRSVKKICIEVHPNITGYRLMNEMLGQLNLKGFTINNIISTADVKALEKSL